MTNSTIIWIVSIIAFTAIVLFFVKPIWEKCLSNQQGTDILEKKNKQELAMFKARREYEEAIMEKRNQHEKDIMDKKQEHEKELLKNN